MAKKKKKKASIARDRFDIEDPESAIPVLESAIARLRQYDLRGEALAAFANGAPIAAFYHDEMADAYFEYLTGLGRRCEELVKQARIDTDLGVRLADGTPLRTDFTLPRFADVERTYRSNMVYLARSGALASPVAASPVMFASGVGPGGILRGGLRLPWWLNKLLSLLGIDEEDLEAIGEHFIEEIGEDKFNAIAKKLDDAIKKAAGGAIDDARKLIDEVGKIIEEVLDKIIKNLDEFIEKLVKKLAKKIGASAAKKKAAKLAAKIASKFIPILGWLLLILELVYLLLKDLIDWYV